jgi:hypothetical protein
VELIKRNALQGSIPEAAPQHESASTKLQNVQTDRCRLDGATVAPCQQLPLLAAQRGHRGCPQQLSQPQHSGQCYFLTILVAQILMPVNGDGDKATKHFSLLHKTVITKLDPIIISHYHNYKPYSKINNNE